MGYTIRLDEAGHYDSAEAAAIVTRANIVSFNEAMIPLWCLEKDAS
jgi:hypothetical protein